MEEVLLCCGWSKKVAAVDLLPEVKELLIHETRPEMHEQGKASRDGDDKSISAKFDDDQRREALVVSWWWMEKFKGRGISETG